MNKELYNKNIQLPKEITIYLKKCYDMFPNSSSETQGHKRNEELRNSGYATYQQLGRMKNWFDSYTGDGKDAPYILNGADYVKNWVEKTMEDLRKGNNSHNEIKNNYMPDNVNDDLIDDMGWLADMNRPSKEHSTFVQDIKIKESLQRINQIIKKII